VSRLRMGSVETENVQKGVQTVQMHAKERDIEAVRHADCQVELPEEQRGCSCRCTIESFDRKSTASFTLFVFSH